MLISFTPARKGKNLGEAGCDSVYIGQMLDSSTEPRPPVPLFSVVVPLEYHRGQWERCWQGWQSQTLEKTAFEIILVAPPDFPEVERLRRIVGTAARLEHAPHRHDIGLCAAGAAAARGEFLFFTEAHCWPEPDLLEHCLRAFRADADFAGFSCRSVRVCRNKLSVAEADMYDADIEYGTKIHPWRKILDQCFVTRRKIYEQCGGFQFELGHFSEWVLAARYSARGYKVGYLPEARMHHYYLGALPALKRFTLDFVAGEIRHFSADACEPGDALLDVPPEWCCRDNFEADMARVILRMSLRELVTQAIRGEPGRQAVLEISRWVPAAIFGDRLALFASAIATIHARVATMLTIVIGSREQLSVRLRRYIAALIHHQRLVLIRADRRGRTAAPTGAATAESGVEAAVLHQTGFYTVERYCGSEFRWSETAAAIRIRARPGQWFVSIKCVPVRSLSAGLYQLYIRVS